MRIKHNGLVRIAAFLLAVLLCAAAVGCGKLKEANPLREVIAEYSSSSSETSRPTLDSISGSSSGSGESVSGSESSGESSSQSQAQTGSYSATVKDVQRRMLSDTIKYYELNKDTVAWLYIPGTTVNESVVRSPEANNDYYLRRTNLGVESTGRESAGWYGCYYTDYRSILGSRLNLSKNLVIYGHSMTDNTDGTRFAQLNKFRDIDFCRSHPYIYFSTIESEMVWQVFAVFYCRVSYEYNDTQNRDDDVIFAYHRSNPTNEEFMDIIDEARMRSFFDFNIPVSAGDKILTLSTCTYNVVDGYPNDYRMVVMAKLLDPSVKLEDTVAVNINVDRLQPDEKAVLSREEVTDAASSED